MTDILVMDEKFLGKVDRETIDNEAKFRELKDFIDIVSLSFQVECAEYLAENFHIINYSEEAHMYVISTLLSLDPEIVANALDKAHYDEPANRAYAESLSEAFRTLSKEMKKSEREARNREEAKPQLQLVHSSSPANSSSLEH